MESSDIIACRNAIVKTSSFADVEVIVTEMPFNDERESFLSNGHLAPEENLQIVEAVSIAASEIKKEETYHGEVPRRSGGTSEDLAKPSRSGIDGSADNDKKGGPVGKEPSAGEQGTRKGSLIVGERLDFEGQDNDVVKREAGHDHSALIESMQRLVLSNRDPPSPGKTNFEESHKRIEEPDKNKQQVYTDVLARGPTGGVPVAFPPSALNCGWFEQPCPGAKRSQFLMRDFADFGNDIFVDATRRNSFPVENDCTVQPSKFRRGPQPVESDDLSPLSDQSLPFISLTPKDIAEVLGTDELTNIFDDFFLPENFYTNQTHKNSQNIKQEFSPYSLGDPLANGSVSGLSPSPSTLQHPSHSSMTIFPATNLITATIPLSQAPTLTTNPPGKFFQPSKTHDPTQFCDGSLTLGGWTGFQAGEASPPESGFGGSDYSQSPHPSTLGSPGREDDFPPEPPENLAEIEAILDFIENEVQPLAGKQLPDPSSTNYRSPLENPLAKHTLDPFHHPPYTTEGSFHPVRSSPVQGSTTSSSTRNTSPAMPTGPNVQSAIRMTRPEGPVDPMTRRTNDTNSNFLDNQLKADQLLTERKQLAKASSVIARLTRDQLIMPDSDQDTLLHLAIAKNERFLTEALISRLDRDKLTDSMINLKNKQGQTPLCLATVTNQWAVVRLLIDRGADVNVRIPLGDKHAKSFCNPLHFAASNGKEWLRTLEQLLCAKTIDLSAIDSEGCSALHKAVMTNGLSLFSGRKCEIIDSRKSVRQLILHGCDINQQDGVLNKTALHITLERGDLDLFYYILDLASPKVSLPLLLNVRTGRRGDTLLHVAATLHAAPSHQLTLVTRMLNCGANPQLRNWDNRLPWELATQPQTAEVLKIPVVVGV